MHNQTNSEIIDDLELLSVIMKDAKRQKSIYKPGPYWKTKSINTANQIKRHGLSDFRGGSSAIGLSYTDSLWEDVRHTLDHGLALPLMYLLEKSYPLNSIFERQVRLTQMYSKQARELRNKLLLQNPRIDYLLSKYTVPESMRGGCMDYIEIDGAKVALHYINLLDQHERVSNLINFKKAKSFFEIGGGFGINVHILIENYNIRKVVYLDICPSLYVGTQYLKSFYGDVVRDYRNTRSLDEIRFEDNDHLEIFAITPWQIEKLNTIIDVFHNAHSFVEMPEAVVMNYANKIVCLPGFEGTEIAMVSYGEFDLNTTYHPDKLPGFFPQKTFQKNIWPHLYRESYLNSYFTTE